MPETLRFLRDDIILLRARQSRRHGYRFELVHARARTRSKRTTSRLPRLYQKYAGHDNNRDSYMASQPETQAMDSILFRAWYPQIMYNHHQTGPIGTVIFAPPFRDPFNYNFDPLMPMELDLVGAAMHSQVRRRGKAGRDDAQRIRLFDVVERRSSDDGLLPQHDRPAHRGDRQSDADRDPARAGEAAAEGRSADADPAAEVAFRAVDRVRAHGESRRAGCRVAVSRDVSLQHLPRWAGTPSSAGAPTPGLSRRRRSRRCRRRFRTDSDRRAAMVGGGGGRPPTTTPAELAKYIAIMRNPARPRSARLHHSGRSARFSDCDEVRQRADQERNRGPPRDRAVHRGGQELSCRTRTS